MKGLAYWDEKKLDLLEQQEYYKTKLKLINKQLVNVEKTIQKKIKYLKQEVKQNE